MSKWILALVFSGITFSGFAQAEVPLVAEKVVSINLSTDCKIVRAQEPKGNLTYKVAQRGGVKTFVRRMYSDLCTSPTQQFITKIYYSLTDDAMSPVVGMVGGNEDNLNLSFVTFSSFVLRGN